MSVDCRDFREWEGFAKKLASRFTTPGVDLEDLEQEALLTVLEELPNYSSEFGVSLKVFLGRRIRDRLRVLYRKALNIVQAEQYWVVKHISGDCDLDVKAETRSRAEAVLRARPEEYVDMKLVKVLVPIGPSLDADSAALDGEGDLQNHEIFGQSPEQEWMSSISERLSEVRSFERSKEKQIEIETILSMRRDGYTFIQIGDWLNKDPEAVKKTWYRARAQKRAA